MKIKWYSPILLLFLTINVSANTGVIELPALPKAKYQVVCLSNIKVANLGVDPNSNEGWGLVNGLTHQARDFYVNLGNGLCHLLTIDSPVYKFLLNKQANVSLDLIDMKSYQLDTEQRSPYLGHTESETERSYTKTLMITDIKLTNKEIGRRFPFPIDERGIFFDFINHTGFTPSKIPHNLSAFVEGYPDSFIARHTSNGRYAVDPNTKDEFLSTLAINQRIQAFQITYNRQLIWDVTVQELFNKQEVEEFVEDLAENIVIARQQAIGKNSVHHYLENNSDEMAEKMIKHIVSSKSLRNKFMKAFHETGESQ